MAAKSITVFVVLWPVAAYAAVFLVAGMDLQALLLDMWLTGGISVLMGLASLLASMKHDYDRQGHIDRLWLYVASKMTCSIGAGFAAYWLAGLMSMPKNGIVGAIIVASFAGTTFLERVTSTLLSRYFPPSGRRRAGDGDPS